MIVGACGDFNEYTKQRFNITKPLLKKEEMINCK
jgi:hypothetical protein